MCQGGKSQSPAYFFYHCKKKYFQSISGHSWACFFSFFCISAKRIIGSMARCNVSRREITPFPLIFKVLPPAPPLLYGPRYVFTDILSTTFIKHCTHNNGTMEGQKGKRIIEVAFQSWHTLLQTKVNKKIDEYRFINRKIYAN